MNKLSTYRDVEYAADTVPDTLRDEAADDASAEEHEAPVQLQGLSGDKVD